MVVDHVDTLEQIQTQPKPVSVGELFGMAARVLEDSSRSVETDTKHRDEPELGQMVAEQIHSNEARVRVGAGILVQFGTLMVDGARYSSVPPGLKAAEPVRQFHTNMLAFEKDLCGVIELYEFSEPAMQGLTELVAGMDLLLNRLASQHPEMNFESMRDRFTSFRGLVALKFSLEEAGYRVEFGNPKEDFGMGIDLKVYDRRNPSKPLFLVDAKSRLGRDQNYMHDEKNAGIHVRNYLRSAIDHKKQTGTDFPEHRRRKEKAGLFGIPHLEINYPRADVFPEYYDNAILGLPSEDGVVRVMGAIGGFLQGEADKNDISERGVDPLRANLIVGQMEQFRAERMEGIS